MLPRNPPQNRTCGTTASGSRETDRLQTTSFSAVLHLIREILKKYLYSLSFLYTLKSWSPWFSVSCVRSWGPSSVLFLLASLRSTGIAPLLHYYERLRLPQSLLSSLGFYARLLILAFRELHGSPKSRSPSLHTRQRLVLRRDPCFGIRQLEERNDNFV